MSQTTPRSFVLIVVLSVLAIGGATGAIFGERAIPEDEQELVLRASEIVTALLEWLPEEHDPADIVYDGIGGMLQVLDPHSSYLDPRSFRHMRARQEGSFFGVGIIISRRNGNVTVISPIAGTPAAARGLRAGDIIAKVAGEETEGRSLDEVVDMVRGPEGTTVVLTIDRPGFKETFDVGIERTRIPQTSVRFSFMIEPDIGYIRLSEFSNTSSREVREAIEALTAQGMNRLIFDLRNNPGGSLDAAVGVSDLFLVEGQLITSTRGRTPENNAVYNAPGNPGAFNGPLVILVNQGSASASEIVSGAVQDHDRGMVLGDVTWGKGLVQTVFTVRDTGLALTTARYYTPSGRCIQRDYESFIDYVTHRNGNDTSAAPIYETDAGRTVLGGGGITPDVIVENRTLSESMVRLFSVSAFFRYAVTILADVPEEAYREFAGGFEVDDEILDGFWIWVVEEEILEPGVIESLQEDEVESADVARSIKAEVFNATLGLNEGYRVALEGDDQMKAAIEHLDEAADFWSAFKEEHSQ
ncbi:MAG: S41 family peptidase [Thermoanaerobaculales bacterium]|jgi:carboxyl-terminal processing protease|nr:S41 family peptidase [Thermoanaerobaculales bacterium]